MHTHARKKTNASLRACACSHPYARPYRHARTYKRTYRPAQAQMHAHTREAEQAHANAVGPGAAASPVRRFTRRCCGLPPRDVFRRRQSTAAHRRRWSRYTSYLTSLSPPLPAQRAGSNPPRPPRIMTRPGLKHGSSEGNCAGGGCGHPAAAARMAWVGGGRRHARRARRTGGTCSTSRGHASLPGYEPSSRCAIRVAFAAAAAAEAAVSAGRRTQAMVGRLAHGSRRGLIAVCAGTRGTRARAAGEDAARQ